MKRDLGLAMEERQRRSADGSGGREGLETTGGFSGFCEGSAAATGLGCGGGGWRSGEKGVAAGSSLGHRVDPRELEPWPSSPSTRPRACSAATCMASLVLILLPFACYTASNCDHLIGNANYDHLIGNANCDHLIVII
jgi:hypothetical protein